MAAANDQVLLTDSAMELQHLIGHITEFLGQCSMTLNNSRNTVGRLPSMQASPSISTNRRCESVSCQEWTGWQGKHEPAARPVQRPYNWMLSRIRRRRSCGDALGMLAGISPPQQRVLGLVPGCNSNSITDPPPTGEKAASGRGARK